MPNAWLMETHRAALWSSNLDNESRTNKGQSSGSSSTYYSRFPILILLLTVCCCINVRQYLQQCSLSVYCDGGSMRTVTVASNRVHVYWSSRRDVMRRPFFYQLWHECQDGSSSWFLVPAVRRGVQSWFFSNGVTTVRFCSAGRTLMINDQWLIMAVTYGRSGSTSSFNRKVGWGRSMTWSVTAWSAARPRLYCTATAPTATRRLPGWMQELVVYRSTHERSSPYRRSSAYALHGRRRRRGSSAWWHRQFACRSGEVLTSTARASSVSCLHSGYVPTSTSSVRLLPIEHLMLPLRLPCGRPCWWRRWPCTLVQVQVYR